jgi:hypothetical protein
MKIEHESLGDKSSLLFSVYNNAERCNYALDETMGHGSRLIGLPSSGDMATTEGRRRGQL